MLAGIPIILLREGTQREQGRDALGDNIRAAWAVANSIRSTLGPRGMDKMLVDSLGDIVITNDGATILKQMEVQHPAAKMLVEVAKAQDQECGDGTKTSVILAGELLKKAEELLEEKVHPTLIATGYRLAAVRSVARLGAIARPVRPEDTELLRKIAMTSMMSKGVAAYRELLAERTVEAVRSVVEPRPGGLRFDRHNIQLVKQPGGDIGDTELIAGHIIEKEVVRPSMPRRAEPARIALVDGSLEVAKTEFAAEIRITDPSQVQAFQRAEEGGLREMAEAIARSGANVVFCSKGIDPLVQEQLAQRGVLAVQRIKREDVELTAKATGARPVTRSQDLTTTDLGAAHRVDERKIGEDHLTVITGAAHAKSVALLIRGGTEHVVAEVERSVQDAIATVGIAIEDGLAVTGASAAAVELALDLRDYATSVGGREQMAVEAFAEALEVIPSTLAQNAGMDLIDSLIELRRRHKMGELGAGVDLLNARIADMSDVAVEPIRVDRQELEGATETAAMILRIDDVISSKRSTAAGAGAPKGGGGEPVEGEFGA